MRTYGRVRQGDALVWVEVDTDANGYNDAVFITTLVQTLKLNLNESPFFANYGIPARNAVQQQLPPDFYAARTQQQYAQYFASLIITRDLSATEAPTYIVNLTTQQGSKIPAFGVAT